MNDLHAKGIQLLRKNEFAEAARCFAGHLKRQPNHASSVHYLGVALSRLGDFTQARNLMETAIRMEPRRAEFHHNLAATYRVLGLRDEAETAYRSSIRLKPDYAEAYFNLSAVRRFPDGEADLSAIEKILGDSHLEAEDREFAHFAAGKIADDMGDYDRAFRHFRRGNELRNRPFDCDQHLRLIENLEKTFADRGFSGLPVSDVDSRLPIFVVGMPRSGTTLVEQILASHPKVLGAGELPDIMSIAGTLSRHASGRPYPENVRELPREALTGFARHYLKLREPLKKPGVVHLVDKMPGNFLHIGLIALLFPKSRIVHCVRDPRDSCLSCYFQRFRAGHEYADRLEDLGFYYQGYERLMQHWKQVSPLPVHDLRYEELIRNQETVTRDLLDYCGLDWHEGCLRFHETARPVTTASSAQVRLPLNRRGLGRWKNYENHLEPLLQSLSDKQLFPLTVGNSETPC